jgi:UDP-glucose:(heptosyl)LPS alpha-1,3-glucosyltransferase
MRIALTFLGAHRRGGVERVVVEAANGMLARGHEVHVHASVWDEGVLDEGVHRHHIPSRTRPIGVHALQFQRRANDALAAALPRYDASMSFGAVSAFGGVLWVPSVHKTSLVEAWERRGWPGRLKQKANGNHYVLLHMERVHYGGRRYAKLVALTERIKGELMQYYDVPAEDVVVQGYGYRPEEFSAQRSAALRGEMRARYGYGEDDRVVVFAANELERKGFDTLLRALAALSEPDVRLLVVGNVRAGAYRREIERLGLSARVHFAGPSADVARQYAAGDAFCLPTRYEAWGLVIVEALAAGLPTVTTRLAGASVTVREGDTGELLDDPEDAAGLTAKLRAVLDRPADREAISASVGEWTWAAVMERMEAIVAEHGARRA